MSFYIFASFTPAAAITVFRKETILYGAELAAWGWSGGPEVVFPWSSNLLWLAGLLLLAQLPQLET